MNLLLIRPQELDANREFTVTGSRAEHIRTVLRAKAGDSVKSGFLNGKIGLSTLLELKKEYARLRAEEFGILPPEPLPVSLVVSLPRPQSFKKVIHFAVSAGIRDLTFIHSVRVEKSYWNSAVLEKEALEAETMEGLEQGFDTTIPDIKFYRHFREFLMDSKTIFPGGAAKIIAHPGQSAERFQRNGCHIVLAIGPEGGFVKSEVEAFVETGFIPMGFGSHILRVEFAASFITGFLMGCK